MFRSQNEEGGDDFGGVFLLCSVAAYVWEELLPLLPGLLDQPRVTGGLIWDYFSSITYLEMKENAESNFTLHRDRPISWIWWL